MASKKSVSTIVVDSDTQRKIARYQNELALAKRYGHTATAAMYGDRLSAAARADKPKTSTPSKWESMQARMVRQARRRLEDATSALERQEEKGNLDAEVAAQERISQLEEEIASLLAIDKPTSDPIYATCAAMTYRSVLSIYQRSGMPLLGDILRGREPELWEDMVGETYAQALDLIQQGKISMGTVTNKAGKEIQALTGNKDDLALVWRAAANFLHSMRGRDARARVAASSGESSSDAGLGEDSYLEHDTAISAWAMGTMTADYRDAIQTAIRHMRAEDYQVLQLLGTTKRTLVHHDHTYHYVDRGYTQMQIAQQLGVTRDTVRASIRRLQGMLEAQGVKPNTSYNPRATSRTSGAYEAREGREATQFATKVSW